MPMDVTNVYVREHDNKILKFGFHVTPTLLRPSLYVYVCNCEYSPDDAHH